MSAFGQTIYVHEKRFSAFLSVISVKTNRHAAGGVAGKRPVYPAALRPG